MGSRALARQAGVSRKTVLRALRGELVRADIAERLLATRPALAHGSVIVGTVTWRSIDSLERDGYTRRYLASQLGFASQQLQLHRHLTVRSALKVAKLYDILASENPS